MGSTNTRSMQGIVTPKILLIGVAAVVTLLVVALATTISLTLQNNDATEAVLVDSVKSQLIASSTAAREIVEDNMDLFVSINSQEDIDKNWDAWVSVIEELRLLNNEIGSEYIYALKEIDGTYYFVFDIDPEVQRTHQVFEPYEISPVHAEAFAGNTSADVMNVRDAWGSFNSGAVPLYDENGTQVGIIATDFPDTYIKRNGESTAFYTTVLIVTTSVAVIVMLIILLVLVRRNSRMQQHLFDLANFDPISGLPNRNNLFSFLACEIDHLKEDEHPFAVFFIDLDNFKTVNDHAGHDTGDELLRRIASFLDAHAKENCCACDFGMEALTARIGGDEFLQLIPGISQAEDASRYAGMLLEAFGKEQDLRKFIENFGVGLSIGVALFPSMQTDYDELIKYADIAMYHAKKNGKNTFKVYDFSMGDTVEGAELSVRSTQKHKR